MPCELCKQVRVSAPLAVAASMFSAAAQQPRFDEGRGSGALTSPDRQARIRCAHMHCSRCMLIVPPPPGRALRCQVLLTIAKPTETYAKLLLVYAMDPSARIGCLASIELDAA